MIWLLLIVRRKSMRYWQWCRRSWLVAARLRCLNRSIELALKWKALNMNEAEKRAENSKLRLWVASAVVVVLGSWVAVAIIGTVNWKNGTAERGQFGDSFGVLGGLFAGLALIAAGIGAYFQWAAMRDERAAAASEAVESRFFQMVESLQAAVNETRVDVNGYVGRQAMRHIAMWLTHLLKPCRNLTPGITDEQRLSDIRQWFQLFYDGNSCSAVNAPPAPAVDLLGHISRLIYHLLKYVNSSTAITAEQKHDYAALLRAHLSNPELVMLFYNAFTVHGFEKHFPLLAGYRMFKNMNRTTLVDPAGDWQLYLNLIEQRKHEIEALVGRVPNSQSDE